MLNFNGVNPGRDKLLRKNVTFFFGMVSACDHLTLVGIVTSNDSGMKRARFEWENFPNQKSVFPLVVWSADGWKTICLPFTGVAVPRQLLRVEYTFLVFLQSSDLNT